MKKKSIVTVFVGIFFGLNLVGQINIQQIKSSEFIFTQSLKVEPLDISSISQLGNYNTARLSQTKEGDLFSFPNSANLFQQGDFNLTDITQRGNENVLLSFQLGYLTYGLSNGSNDQSDAQLQNAMSFTISSNGLFTGGSNNTLYSSQEGVSNKVLAIQQGSSHYIDVEQWGNGNNFIVQQVGTNNRVENFKQNSLDGISDVVSQLGDNITLNTLSESNGVYGNDYIQEGSYLTLTINNTLPSFGDIKVTQTGRDMNIVIDQSFFSSPMK